MTGATSTSIAIPFGVKGKVSVILETSSDKVTWTPAQPGTYGTDKKLYFRVRMVKVTDGE